MYYLSILLAKRECRILEAMTQQNITEEQQNEITYENASGSFSRLGWMFLIGTAVIYAVQMLVSNGVKLVKPEWLEDPTISLIFSMIPLYLIGMPALIAFVKRIPGKAPEKRTMKKGHFLIALIMCYAIMYCSNFVGVIITTIIGLVKGQAVDNAILDIALNSNMAVTFIYMVICAPIMEEYIFRKLIVDRTMRYGEGVAVVLSGLMFGLFHGNLSQFVYATTLGMFFAFLYVKTGNLKITIALHMFINFMGAVVSTLILKGIHFVEYSELAASGDMEGMMSLLMTNLPAWMAYVVYIFVILALVITGIVLLIVFRKRFVLRAGEVTIPKGQRFKTIFLNFGMLVYSLFWIGMIISQLFQ